MLGAGALAAAGCGDDDDATTRKVLKIQAANEPPEVFAERLAKQLETATTKKDCTEIAEINDRSFTTLPCPAPPQLRKSMARFEVLDVEAYGTGGLIDYKSGQAKKGATIVTFVAPNRGWAIGRFGIITEPSVGTSDAKSRRGFDKAVDGYLEGVRERDCDTFSDYAVTGAKDRKTVCRTEFRATADLARRLRTNRAAPKYLGGTRLFGFYSLETRRPQPENVTISVARVPASNEQPYLVLDVTPSPTAAELRDVREQALGSSGGTPEPERSPSRKAGG